jgi:simple sugar transport system permease protein
MRVKAGSVTGLLPPANFGIIAVPVGLLMIAGELKISIGAMIPGASMCIGFFWAHSLSPW